MKKFFSFLRSLLMPFTEPSPKFENKNEALSDLSRMFFDDADSPSYGITDLDKRKFDFSVDSLEHVDLYLEKIRTEQALEQDWYRTVLRAGAYVGEVIRKNDVKRKWQWIDFETAAQLNGALLDSTTPSIGAMAILYSLESDFVFPLAKVEKYLINGSEDSVHFFAQVILAYKKNAT